MNNLRQIAMASLNYESARRSFPPGYLSGRDFSNPGALSDTLGMHQWCGVFVHLLPYMEAGELETHFGQTLKLGTDQRDDNYWADESAWFAAQWSIPALICPSVPGGAPEAGILDQTYGQQSGGSFILRNGGWPPQVQLGITHYQAVSGVYGEIGDSAADRLVGVFSIRSRTQLRHVIDGASKTLLFGEAPGTIGREAVGNITYSGFIYGVAWAGTATLPVAFGLNTAKKNAGMSNNAEYDTHWTLYGSVHPGVVLFCLADGSMRPLNKDIEETLYRGLASIKGEELTDSSR